MKSISVKTAEILNFKTMMFHNFIAIFLVVAGLFFDFGVRIEQAKTAAIIMYIVAGLVFVVSEIYFIKNAREIKNIKE